MPDGDPTAVQTAVVVPVPDVEPLVAGHRRRLDVAAGWGVPAHVTVLYPFLAPAEVDAAAVAALAEVVARTAAFDCTFATTEWFGDDVVWLSPEPADPFRTLTADVAARFPGHPPYGGAHDDVVPHLTLGESARGSLEDLRAAEADVRRRLPLTTHLTHAVLLAGDERAGSWHALARLPLGGA